MITLVRILIIWVLAWLLIVISRNAIRIFNKRILSKVRQQGDIRRIDTLNGVFRHAASFLIVGIAILLTLDEVGFSIMPLLATAGVAGIAIGFGAQNLVKDFISGLFMLIEGQVSEGDFVETAGKAGIVEQVTLRHIRLRDETGSVHFIPNGAISVITNNSREYAYAVIDVTVPRDTNLEELLQAMHTVAEEMRSDPSMSEDIAGEFVVDGIEKLEAANMVVRCRLRVAPAKQLQVRRMFLKRMKNALEERLKKNS